MSNIETIVIVGAGQAGAVNKLINDLGPDLFTTIHADLAGIDRVITASL